MAIQITDIQRNQDKWWCLPHFETVTNLKSFQKFKFCNFEKTLHMTHFPKLLDKMWKYEVDVGSMVGLKTQSQHNSVHRWKDGQTDKMKPAYPPPPPFYFVEGIMNINEICWCQFIYILFVHAFSALHTGYFKPQGIVKTNFFDWMKWY